MNAFRFHDPLFFLLLIPLVGIIWWKRRSGTPAVVYSSTRLLEGLPKSWAQRVRPLLPWLWRMGMILLIIAMARPQLGQEEVRLHTDGLAIMMCIDRSGSMRALDFPLEGKRVDRLEVVKRVFRDFVAGKDGFAGRVDDLVGLVAFGGFAESKCPPTLDHDTLLKILDTVKIPEPILDSRGNIINELLLREEQATAIGDAIGVAVDRLKDLQIKSKIIVLLSDGESNAGVLSTEEATEAALAYGIKIYCIGVGTNGLAPFKATDMFGRQVIQNQQVRLDEESMKKIASKTEGRYFNATDTEALKEVYAEIDKLEKTKTEGKIYTDYRDVFQWLMLPGLAFILLQLILTSTRFRTIP
jgi:Ca-activated chloride channel homolog